MKNITYTSGNKDPRHFNGVGFIVDAFVSKAIKSFISISDHVCLLQINVIPVTCNFIQVYTLTCDASEKDIESFYQDIEKALELTRSSEINIIMGNFNAKVGKSQNGGNVGRYGLGIPNNRGERLN